MNRVLIGDEEDQHVSIVVLRRDSHDAGDQAWLLTRVSVRAGQWTGKFKACVRLEEFAAFRRRLKSLSAGRRESVRFGSIENWLTLKLTARTTGQVLVEGAAINECGTGHLMKFNFEIDATQLPNIIEQLTTIARC